MTLFISESNKKTLLKKLIAYIGITAFIALFGCVYEQFSHNVHTFYMWFAWIWVLGFGVVPYLLLYLLPIKKVPGLISESIYNLGVALITARSIYIGVIVIYNTTGEDMIMAYTVISIVCLCLGAALYLIGLLTSKSQEM